MPLSFGYKRYFIMLNEEEKGYEITGGKQPTGYVGIELKRNKIKIKGFIQNIKTDDKSDYRLFLLTSGDDSAIEIGSMRSENGKGEIIRELDLEDIKASADYSTAIVMTGESVVLLGFKGGLKEKADIPARFKKKFFKAESEPYPKEDFKSLVSGETLESKAFVEPNGRIGKEVSEPEQEELIVRIDMEDTIKETDSIAEKERVAEKAELKLGDKLDSIDDINEAIEEEELFTGEGSRGLDKQHFYHHFHQICDEDTESKPKKDIKQNGKYPEIIELLKNLAEVDKIDDMENRRWFAIDDKLHLLNKITININGINMPLSYPYLAKGCGPWINEGILGAEYDGITLKKIFIGLPGVYINHFESFFKLKGFTKHIKAKKDGKGYWIMCIDLHKGSLCGE